MPLRWFKCKKLDNELVLLEDCYKCHQCMTEPTLRALSKDREWTGNPSTTQLLNGTMMEFLKITRDYASDPQHRAFMLHGTNSHGYLEAYAKELGLPSEIAMSPDGHDVFDLIERDVEKDNWTLTDYKTWGSYKVAKSLGIVKIGKGKDATFTVDQSKIDLKESELQLNHYRIMLEKIGIAVGDMQLQLMVRDGGISVAMSRGIDFNIKLIPISKLDDNLVLAYFNAKRQNLLHALKEYANNANYFPEPCNSEESWENRRCQGYCDVAEFCPKGIIEKGGVSIE